MSTAQERREKSVEEFKRKFRTVFPLPQQLSGLFYRIGDIYTDAAKMYAIAYYILEQIDDAYRAEAPVDKNTRTALMYQLHKLEDYRERVYEGYEAWLPYFVDWDYLERTKPPDSELPRLALEVLDSLEDLRGKIEELRKRVETKERFTQDELDLARDIYDDASIPVLHLSRLAYWDIVRFLQWLYPELFQSK